MTDVPSVEELDRLSTEELRQRAFDLAESRKDVGFFLDIYNHMPATETAATEDASSGAITGGIAELVTALRDMFGGSDHLGDAEPLFRARFIDYLRSSD